MTEFLPSVMRRDDALMSKYAEFMRANGVNPNRLPSDQVVTIEDGVIQFTAVVEDDSEPMSYTKAPDGTDEPFPAPKLCPCGGHILTKPESAPLKVRPEEFGIEPDSY